MATKARKNDGEREDAPALPGLLEDAVPPGFCYRADLISRDEELALVQRFETLPFKPFEFQGYLGNRRIVSYGHRYDYAKRSLEDAAALPPWLMPLRSRAGCLLGVPPETLQQALITEYAPGAGIGWHRDKPMFEHVVAFSFLTPCILRLRKGGMGQWERAKQFITPRSAYILSGEAREIWEHSIAPLNALRYSVTFRDLRTVA